MQSEEREDDRSPDLGRNPRPDQERDDASEAAGGAATGAILGTAIAGPFGLAAGAAAGAVAGGAAEAGDGDDEPEGDFERTAEPGDRSSVDLRLPGQGGHVGGSDPEHA